MTIHFRTRAYETGCTLVKGIKDFLSTANIICWLLLFSVLLCSHVNHECFSFYSIAINKCCSRITPQTVYGSSSNKNEALYSRHVCAVAVCASIHFFGLLHAMQCFQLTASMRTSLGMTETSWESEQALFQSTCSPFYHTYNINTYNEN